MPDKPMNLMVELHTGGGPYPPPTGRDVEVVPGVVYRPRTDELILTIGTDARLVLGPGKRFAEALARTMTEAVERENRIADFMAKDDDLQRCEKCGADVREIVLNTGDDAVIEPVPSAGGVYVRLADGLGRLLNPFETPTMPVYAKHRCKRS